MFSGIDVLRLFVLYVIFSINRSQKFVFLVREQDIKLGLCLGFSFGFYRVSLELG